MADESSNPPPPEPEHEPLEYGRARPNRLVAWTRGWADEYLSRESLSSSLKTMLWVAPLTALIWIYAERQQQDKKENVTVQVTVVSSDPNKVVTLANLGNGNTGNVIVTLLGAKSAVEDFIRSKDERGNPPLQIQLESGATSGPIQTTRIGQDKRLKEFGIMVVAAQPETIQLSIDEMVEKLVTVRADNPGRFTRDPRFDPPQVKVRGPSRVLENAHDLEVLADLSSVQPSKENEQEIKVADPKLSLNTVKYSNVSVVQQSVTAYVLPVVPRDVEVPTVRFTHYLVSQQIYDNYLIVPDSQQLADVQISGPSEVVSKVSSSSTATLKIDDPPDPSQGAEAAIIWNFGKDVVVKDPRKTIHVKLVPRG